MLAAAKGVIRATWRAGLVTWDVQLRLLASLPAVRGGRVTRGRALTWHEFEKLLAAARGYEERALLATLAGAGCRRAEVLALTWDRFTRHDRTFYLRVLGKGNKERRLRVPSWVASALSSWRTRCPDRERIFRWRNTDSVRDVVVASAARAGLGPLAPHDMRRTFYALCCRSGMRDRDIQRAMGHASISTTMKYDRRGDEEALAEMSRLDSLAADGAAGAPLDTKRRR
jgi:integrase